MLESDSAILAHVIPRWLRLKYKLKALFKVYLYLKPILAQGGVFSKQLHIQTQLIHWAAFVLDPTSHLRVIDVEGRESVIKWILQHVEYKKEVSYSIQDFLL